VLYLRFQIGDDNYALPARELEDLVHRLPCKKIPQAPAWVDGLAQYRGKSIPVIDLCQLAEGKKAKRQLGTRMMVMNLSHHNQSRTLALVAEQITTTLHHSELNFKENSLQPEHAPWLGKVAYIDQQLIQLIEPQALLNDDLCALIFQTEDAAA